MKVKHKSLTLALAAMMLSASASHVNAQAVIFPQLEQPGVATLTQANQSYTLANDLLSATFSVVDGRLIFDGCAAMGLKPGTELFYVETEAEGMIPASKMTMGNVAMTDLTANPAAPRGSERYAGKALTAQFTHGNLTIEWSAVLRDGSHYLRTEMVITSAPEATSMRTIVPMNYMVAEGEPTIETVGNTRGAILASTKVFAGVETPMGQNVVGSKIVVPEEGPVVWESEGFKLNSWTSETFCWAPGRDVPSQILDVSASTTARWSVLSATLILPRPANRP